MKYLLFILFSSALLTGCSYSEKIKQDNATGKPGEILIVIDNNLWEKEPGKELRNALTVLTPGFQQEEHLFSINNISPLSFSDPLRSSRNIIIVKNCDPSMTTSLETKNNLYATSQAYMEISAPDINHLSGLIRNNAEKIFNYFTSEEIKRQKDSYSKYRDNDIIQKISAHNINLIVPKGFKLITDTADFTWIISESPGNILGIFIYETDYKDTSVFSNEYMLLKRDSIMKNNCPGTIAGSWMTTEHNFPVYSQTIMINNIQMYEMRGQWKIQNDFMNGPFVSLSAIDKKRNKAITVEGYVYAPKSEKTGFIRQLEGILYSFEFLE